MINLRTGLACLLVVPTFVLAPQLPAGLLHHLLQVRPLRKQLTGLRAWITGQRKDQSPGTRMAVPVVQVRTAVAF